MAVPSSARFLAPSIEVRLLWFDSGSDLYRVAVYASPLSEERVEMLFSGLSLQ